MKKIGKPALDCPNCGALMVGKEIYCSNCGQQYTDGKVTIKDLFGDFFEAVFNLDSAFLQTMRNLMLPGKLSEAYFLGQQKRYVRPLRLFFLIAVLHFAVINFVFEPLVAKEIQQQVLNTEELSFRGAFLAEMDTISQRIIQQAEDTTVARRFIDSVRVAMAEQGRDSFQLLTFMYFQQDKDSLLVPASYRDALEMPIDSFLQYYEIEGFWNKIFARQHLRTMYEGDDITQVLLSYFVWMVLLMMPALALVLKLLYVRRKRYFVEHLIFSFHYHAFAFLVFSIAFLLVRPLGGWVIALAFPAVLVYLFLAMRRFYHQGFFKTFLKFTIFNFAYLYIVGFFFTLTTIAGALSF